MDFPPPLPLPPLSLSLRSRRMRHERGQKVAKYHISSRGWFLASEKAARGPGSRDLSDSQRAGGQTEREREGKRGKERSR